jgi:hypothetical protein
MNDLMAQQHEKISHKIIKRRVKITFAWFMCPTLSISKEKRHQVVSVGG